MFRFTIRDVLWLTMVVTVGVLRWGEYRQRMTDSADLRATLKRVENERDEATASWRRAATDFMRPQLMPAERRADLQE